MTKTSEQLAHDFLERLGILDAQSLSADDVVELTNLFEQIKYLKSALAPSMMGAPGGAGVLAVGGGVDGERIRGAAPNLGRVEEAMSEQQSDLDKTEKNQPQEPDPLDAAARRETPELARDISASRARMAGLLTQILTRFAESDRRYANGRFVPITHTMRAHIDAAVRYDNAIEAERAAIEVPHAR